LCGAAVCAAIANEPPADPEPAGQLRIAAVHVAADERRGVDDGSGIEIGYGRPFRRGWRWEAVFSPAVLETGPDGGTDFYETSAGVDFARELRVGARWRPFVVAGAGLVENDVFPDAEDSVDPYWQAGVGAVSPAFGSLGIRLRPEARYRHDAFRGGVDDTRFEISALVPLGKPPTERVVERIVYREVPVPTAPPVIEDRDSDDDGVEDRIDRCPNTIAAAQVDRDGCIRPAQSIELAGVNFATASAELTPGAERILERVFLTLRDQPGIVVEIAGHTDSIGSDGANAELSERRAATVRAFLVAKGIDPSRLDARGYGESEPLTVEATEADRARNRRVEFRVRDTVR
jgi:OmpA-OmpF porin, OOP family